MAETVAAVPQAGEREVSPLQLSLEQLNSIKSQLEAELQEIQKQLESLNVARSRFANSKLSLQQAATAKVDDKLLVPLNASLYVPGRVVDPDKVRESFLFFL
jgi:prefoldin alpha subunit